MSCRLALAPCGSEQHAPGLLDGQGMHQLTSPARCVCCVWHACGSLQAISFAWEPGVVSPVKRLGIYNDLANTPRGD